MRSDEEHVEETSKHLDAGKWVTHGCCQRTKPMSDLVAYVDGGSLGNPGPSGIGVVIEGSKDGTIRIAKWIGHQDNNVAEYVALLEALQCATGLEAKVTSCVFRFRGCGQADEGRVHLPQPAALLAELDLPIPLTAARPGERTGHTSPRPRLFVSPQPGMGNADDVKNDEQRYREGRNQAQGTRFLPGTE